MPKAETEMELTAYEIDPPRGMQIEPAPVARQWMDDSVSRFAYRCLPLVIANQNGWIIRCPTRFTARWNGGKRKEDLRFWFPRGVRETRISSHFGDGIITFSLPYLFQTPPGINLWVKGPGNLLKDGVQPLEGIVETDWSHSTFTMNWKITRDNCPIRFEQNEPICMVLPVARGFTEQFHPVIRPLKSNSKLCAKYKKWSRSRKQFNESLQDKTSDAIKAGGWQRDYMLGVDEDGGAFTEHQTNLRIQEFDHAKHA